MYFDTLISSKATSIFPESSWASQKSLYDTYLKYWTGEIWRTLAENVQVESGKPPLRWPVKINLVKILSLMHAMALWGEWEDEIVTFRFENKDPSEISSPGAIKQEEAAKRLALEGQKLVNAVWAENHRETLLIEQALAAQVYGGCVFRLRRDKDKKHEIKIEYLSPYFFRPIWHPTDFHTLLEARIQFKISGQQARLVYGDKYYSDSEVEYRETWTKETHKITVGGKVYLPEEENPYGVIPFAYIPRLRMEQFYGISLCEDLMGLQDEFNDRVADIGDQILNECHGILQLANYRGDAQKLRPTPSGILNLGMGVPGYPAPALTRVPPGDTPRGAKDYIQFLLDTAKMAAFTPPVAFGLDEGSQRSGVTLIIRMWPLLQQCKWSRAWWDDGFRDINRLILTMLKTHGFKGYKEELEGHRTVTQWAPIQPKDREALVEELVQLAGSDLQSLETAVERLANTQDNEQEIARIKGWMQFKARVEDGEAKVVQGNSAQEG